MYIYNTTYTVSKELRERWLVYVSEELLPESLKSGELKDPKMYKVMVGPEQDLTYSIQFKAESARNISTWQKESRDPIGRRMHQLFGDKVLGFSTLLKELP